MGFVCGSNACDSRATANLAADASYLTARTVASSAASCEVLGSFCEPQLVHTTLGQVLCVGVVFPLELEFRRRDAWLHTGRRAQRHTLTPDHHGTGDKGF